MKTRLLTAVAIVAGVCGLAQAASGKMLVSLTFDDGPKDFHDLIAPMLETNGMRGTFNLITERIGVDPWYMTWDDARDLVRRGHALESHTCNHINMAETLQAGKTNEIVREVCESAYRIAAETGVRPEILCHPFISGNEEVNMIIRNCGLIPMTGMRINFGAGTVAGTPTGVGAYLKRRIAEGRVFSDLMVHGVRKGVGWEPFDKPEDFDAFLKEIKSLEAAGLIEVVLYRDAMKRFNTPELMAAAMR